MVLNVTAEYPQSSTYVLKLRRDAAPGAGRLRGRLEHAMSGEQRDFSSFEELRACLIALTACASKDNP